MKTALELLTEAAAYPECDELFRRVPHLDPVQFSLMVERLRAERASWGKEAEE